MELLEKFNVGKFRKDHWRKRPLFIKGGAKMLLKERFSYGDFDKVADDLRNKTPDVLRERFGEVTFIEAVSRYFPNLSDAQIGISQLLGFKGGWFDGVRTYSQSGIGSHYDHSDNFVLQQQGTKTWKIAPPDQIPAKERACRMLNVGEFGAVEIDDSVAETFVLEPGDLLYLPLFWLHSGVSAGPSLSLSLVCPAEPMQTLLLRATRSVMTRHLLGYQPVSTPPIGLQIESFEKWEAGIFGAASLLLGRINQDDLLNEIVQEMRALALPEANTE